MVAVSYPHQPALANLVNFLRVIYWLYLWWIITYCLPPSDKKGDGTLKLFYLWGVTIHLHPKMQLPPVNRIFKDIL